MKFTFIFFLLFGVKMINYGNNQDFVVDHPIEEPAKILKNLMSLLYYDRDYLRLSEDFIALDDENRKISKGIFFALFSTGNYLPLRLSTKNATASYKLLKLNTLVNNDIRTTIKGWGEIDYQHFKMEGKKLATFNFVDLNGKVYNAETTKGKILVLKAWYLGCRTCREEIPALNRLVKQFENRKDVLFVSIAFDSKKELVEFSKRTLVDYALVPDQKNYLLNTLKIQIYPTHLIINKDGFILKVVNSADELAIALKKATSN